LPFTQEIVFVAALDAVDVVTAVFVDVDVDVEVEADADVEAAVG
jgi:hypothetical protein